MTDRSSISDYMKSLYKFKVLTREEERELWQKMQDGDWMAEERLISHNLRFAITVLKKMPQWRVEAVPREDLIAFANMGLLAAARKWTPQGEIKFCTYAKSFIRRYVNRNVENTQHIIRVPVRTTEKIRKMLYTERVMTQKLKRAPTRQELADELGMTPKVVDTLRGVLQREPSSLDVLLSYSNNLEDES